MGSAIGSQMVTFYVGAKKENCPIHKNMICAKSPVIRNLLKLKQNQRAAFIHSELHPSAAINEAGTITLLHPVFSRKAFSYFTDYVYSSRVPENMGFNDCIEVLNIASILRATKLVNLIMDHLQMIIYKIGRFTSKEIGAIYAARLGGRGPAQLWALCLRNIAARLMKGIIKEKAAKKLKKFIVQNTRLPRDLFDIQIEIGQGLMKEYKPGEEDRLDTCEFHVYDKDFPKETCYRRMQAVGEKERDEESEEEEERPRKKQRLNPPEPVHPQPKSNPVVNQYLAPTSASQPQQSSY